MLDAHCVLRTQYFEEARTRYGEEGLLLVPMRTKHTRAASFYEASRVEADGFKLYLFRNGIDTGIATPPDHEYYKVFLPLAAPQLRPDGIRLRALRQRAFLASTGAIDPMPAFGQGHHLGLALTSDYMHKFASSFLGEQVDGIQFDPRFDFSRSVHHGLSNLMTTMVEDEIETPGSWSQSTRLLSFRDVVAQLLLLHWPNDQAHRIERPVHAPAPRSVKRVVDAIKAEPEQPYTLADLARIGEVPQRTLHDHFRNFTGMAPMAYLRMERLRMARKLMKENAVNTVTDAATASGHWHMGRFSKAYAQAFGEAPRETLVRSRSRLH